MKAVLLIVSLVFGGNLFSQIEAIEFNASFNKANGVDWLEELTDCSVSAVDIMASPDLQKKHKIVVVPTILILDDGEEIARFQANIMMTMEATRKEVQKAIDELLMSDF